MNADGVFKVLQISVVGFVEIQCGLHFNARLDVPRPARPDFKNPSVVTTVFAEVGRDVGPETVRERVPEYSEEGHL